MLPLNSCIDSLDLRLSKLASPSSWLQTQVPIWREYIDTVEIGTSPLLIELPGLGHWRLKFSGHRPYEFVLINPQICDLRIWNPDKWASAIQGQTGQVYISFRSQFLQAAGLDGVRDFVEQLQPILFSTWSGGFLRVSRADIATDLQIERGFSWDDMQRFVSRSRFRDVVVDSGLVQQALQTIEQLPPNRITRGALPTTVTLSQSELETIRAGLEVVAAIDDQYLYRVCHNRQPQTLYFGRFGGALYARIYDKLASLDKQAKGYMRQIWTDAGWDGVSPVWRFEFSLSGDFLREAVNLCLDSGDGQLPQDLRDFDRFCDSMHEIWAYLTSDWLRFCPHTEDSNLWRSPLDPVWIALQSAWPESQAVLRHHAPPVFNDEQLTAQLKGLALTVAARRSHTDTLSESSFSICFDLWHYMESSSFEHDLKQRRCLLGVDDLSDSQFSAEVRSHRMLEGNGS